MSIRKVVIIDEMTLAQLASETARSVLDQCDVGYGFKLVRNENGASIGTYLEMIGAVSHLPRCENKNCGGTLAEDGTCPACLVGPLNPEAAWNAWVESRPDSIRTIARRLSPRTDYRIQALGDDYYRVMSIDEDGTVTAIRFDSTTGSAMWIVFGLDPNKLVPWHDHPWPEITPQ